MESLVFTKIPHGSPSDIKRVFEIDESLGSEKPVVRGKCDQVIRHMVTVNQAREVDDSYPTR
jgi:hypothetical protein